MKVLDGQPWKARARASMHCTRGERGMSALSDLRTEESLVSTPALKTVEGCHLLWLVVCVNEMVTELFNEDKSKSGEIG